MLTRAILHEDIRTQQVGAILHCHNRTDIRFASVHCFLVCSVAAFLAFIFCGGSIHMLHVPYQQAGFVISHVT